MMKTTVNNYKKDKYYPRVVKAVEQLLSQNDVIATVEVLIKMGNLSKKNYESWKNGNVTCLESVFEGSLSKANRILRIIKFHAHDLNMKPSSAVYKKSGKGAKHQLKFSKSEEKRGTPLLFCYLKKVNPLLFSKVNKARASPFPLLSMHL